MISENSSPPAEEIHRSGEQITEAQPGSLCCVSCGFAFSMSALDSLPECPNCHGRSFRRASIFDRRPRVDVAAKAASSRWSLAVGGLFGSTAMSTPMRCGACGKRRDHDDPLFREACECG